MGRTGVRVSQLCLGAMMFGAWGNPDHAESVRIMHRALDAGINFIDTADMYSDGESEQIVAEALGGGKRDGVVLATKFHFKMGEDPNQGGNSRRWIMRAVEDSLRRLRTDWIDLYQVHRPDPGTDLDETIGALSDLVRAGKIRYFGTSTYPAHELVTALWLAERRGLERVACEQPPYSILHRAVEADVLPVCQRNGIGVIPWSPLAGGWLSGNYRKDRELPTSRRSDLVPAVVIGGTLTILIALAWTRLFPGLATLNRMADLRPAAVESVDAAARAAEARRVATAGEVASL